MAIAIVLFCQAAGLIISILYTRHVSLRAKRAEATLCRMIHRVQLMDSRITHVHRRFNALQDRVWHLEHGGYQLEIPIEITPETERRRLSS